MNKNEIKAAVTELLSAGTPKSEVFARLSGQGVKDSRLAYLIASHPDPLRCSDNERKVNALITLMILQAVVAFLVGFGIGMKVGPNARWILGGLLALIPLAFAWGFYKHQAGAYNVYIVFSIVQLPKSLEGLGSGAVTASIGFAIGVAMLVYVWYVRQQIFPDFTFITPRKTGGRYVFADT